MGILKAFLKIFLFISVVLAFGQISVGQKTIGHHFVSNVNEGSRHLSQQLLQMKWLAGVPLPEFVQNWLKKPTPPKKKAEIDPIGQIENQEEISKADREAMLKLLKE